MSEGTTTLDVRQIPPRERHPKIFQTFDALRNWDGFGGLIYFHLLLKSLKEKEVIGG